MRLNSMAAFAAGAVLTATAPAHAVIVIPQLGTVATESVVGAIGNGFHSTGGLGEPGYPLSPDHNPKGFFGDLASASAGYDRETSANGRITTYAAGSAAADLYTAQMHLVANGQYRGGGLNNVSLSTMQAAATMADVITITGTIAKPTPVQLSFVIDGGFTGTGITANPFETTANFSINLGGGNYAQVLVHDFTGSTVDIVDESGIGGKLTVQSSAADALRLTLTETVTVTDTSRRIPFLLGGSVNAVPIAPGDIAGDFGSTARLVLDLPDGLGFTSQSGVLLSMPQDTDPVSTAVPEPAAALLLAAPALLLACRRTRGAARDLLEQFPRRSARA